MEKKLLLKKLYLLPAILLALVIFNLSSCMLTMQVLYTDLIFGLFVVAYTLSILGVTVSPFMCLWFLDVGVYQFLKGIGSYRHCFVAFLLVILSVWLFFISNSFGCYVSA